MVRERFDIRQMLCYFVHVLSFEVKLGEIYIEISIN